MVSLDSVTLTLDSKFLSTFKSGLVLKIYILTGLGVGPRRKIRKKNEFSFSQV